MKRILFYIAFISFIIEADEKILKTNDIIDILYENNKSIFISNKSQELSWQKYQQSLSLSKAKINFVTDSYNSPLYGYSKNTSQGTGEDIISESHKFSGSVVLSQPIETGGNILFNIDNDLIFNSTNNFDSYNVSQTPSFGLTISQPIITNNKFIDFKSGSYSFRKNEINYQIATMNEIETKNSIILNLLRGIHTLNYLRRNVDLYREKANLSEVKVTMALEDRERGIISTSELLKIEIGIGREKELLFDLINQQSNLEENIKNFLGVKSITDYIFDLEITEITIPNKKENYNSLKVKKATLDYEDKQLTAKVNNISNAPVLSFFVNGFPNYPIDRSESSDIINSFTDYFDGGSDINYNFGLTLNWSLYDGQNNKIKKSIDKISIDIAKEKVIEAEKNNKEKISNIYNNIKLINEKINLINKNLTYDYNILEREKDLLEIGSSTLLDLKEIELEIKSRENDIYKLKGELFLTMVELEIYYGNDLQDYFEK